MAIQTTLSASPVQQFTDNNGVPLAGGLLFLYAAGTTTKQAAYTDSTGATALPNPIVLNARGEVSASAAGTSCGLWLDASLAYKMVLSLPNDSDPPTAPIWTVDNINASGTTVVAGQSWQEIAVYNVDAQAAYAFALPTQYRRFRVTLQGVNVSNNATNLTLQFSSNGGVSYVASGYAYFFGQWDTAGNYTFSASNSSLTILVGDSLYNAVQNGALDMVFEIYPGSSSLKPSIVGKGRETINPGTVLHVSMSGEWATATPALINYARISASAGTWTGQMILEGLP